VKDRGVDLPAAYARAEAGLAKAGGDAEARRLMSAFLNGFGDGHLRVEWPAAQAIGATAPATPSAPARPADVDALCSELGFSSWGEDSRAVARRLPGYQPLPDTPGASYFPAGTIRRNGRTIGVLRIHLFMPQARPDLCREMLAAAPEPKGPCDVFCRNRLMARIEARYSDALAQQLDALNKAGADVLLLDLAANGGGSDWVGAAARMLSPKPLRAQPLGLIRHPDFARRLEDQAEQLKTYAGAAAGEERALLSGYARQAEAAAAEVGRPCDRSALWEGREPGCSGVVTTACSPADGQPIPCRSAGETGRGRRMSSVRPATRSGPPSSGGP
jgi:hypothetical protein